MAKSSKQPPARPDPAKRDPMHGTRPGDRISGDKIIVKCRKPDGGWQSFRMSANHNGFRICARMNATAVIEQGYRNVRP